MHKSHYLKDTFSNLSSKDNVMEYVLIFSNKCYPSAVFGILLSSLIYQPYYNEEDTMCRLCKSQQFHYYLQADFQGLTKT